MRALCGQTVLKFPAPDAASFEDSLARARDFITRWKGHPLIVPGARAARALHLHAWRSCAPAPSWPLEFDVPLHTHLAETAFEVEQSRREHGMPVVPWVKKQRLFDARVLAAHCVHVDEGEMRDAEERRRRRRAQPDEQPEARVRRRAGREDARARRHRRHRHRRRRRRTTTSTCSRRCGWRRCSPKGIERRSDGAAGARGAGDGDAHRRARDPPRRHHRLARARQARRSDRRRSRSGRTTCRASRRDPNARLLADRLRRQVHRRRRRDVRRPLADARPPRC